MLNWQEPKSSHETAQLRHAYAEKAVTLAVFPSAGLEETLKVLGVACVGHRAQLAAHLGKRWHAARPRHHLTGDAAASMMERLPPWSCLSECERPTRRH